MAQQKTTRKSGETNLHSKITQSQSLLNVNELETRAKATVKDISDLYTALQGLVPTKSPHNRRHEMDKSKARSATSGTDTDTARSSEEWDQPRLRRYHSEKYAKKQLRDTNMNFVAAPRKHVWEKLEKPVLEKTLSDERLFVSDTEVELNNTGTNEHKKLQRHFSLPAYEEEEEDSLKTSNDTDGSTKRSKFSLFRRRRRSKPGKKKNSSWRSFFSTLSIKRRKSKKHGKNKVGHGITTNTGQNDGVKTPKHVAKNVSVPIEDRSPKFTPRPSIDVVENIGSNSDIRKSGRKKMAPEPPVGTSSGNTGFQLEAASSEPRERLNTFGTKSDMVQKKFTAWYKQAVKETNSSTLKEPLRATRSHENLLTDTEILRKRGTFSSDTDSFSGGDRNTVQNVARTKVRKTRARRNRRRERARFHSCPNVKLVTKALDEAEKKANSPQVPANLNTTTKGDCTDDVSQTHHTCITTVKPVEAKLSFGSSLDNDEHVTDLKLQNAHARNWMTRQCSKTTIGCIRPLQLNLFYSESPSRETVHRSRSTIHRPRVEGQESGAGNPQEFAFKIRRSSSRRRKRRSFKRGQTRLPHQSPFYVPPVTLNVIQKDQPEEDCSTISKDSGLGSPVATHDKRFGTFPIMKRDQRLAKLHSESEDSGWASSYRHFASTSDTGIQTDPVIVMIAVSKVRRPVLPHVITEDNSQSEA